MRLLKRTAASVLLSCVTVLVLNAQSETKSPTVFTLNNKPVSTEEFIYLYRKNHQHKPEEFTREKIGEYLTLFINYKLKVEEALSRGMDTTAHFKKEFQTYRDELLKPYLPDTEVIDSLVLMTYERLKEEVNASHILITVDPAASPQDTLEAYRKISEVRTRAVAGQDFETLAAEYSEEPNANVTKGNLGYFTAMQMVFPFEQAAYLTPVGEVSMPVRTRFGYHIIKVLDRQPSRGEVEISHIMIRSDEQDESDHARNTIFDVYDKLQKGMNWDELCRQYSEDPNSRESGGKLRPFGVGAMASVPEFQEMAFSLQEVGEISDPVKTRYGWHILRLEAKIPLPAFEELKPALTQRVSRDERVQISREAIRKKMQSEFGYRENRDVIDRLNKNAENILTNGSEPGSALKGEEVLFTLQEKPYRVEDFMNFLGDQPAGNGATPRPQYLQQQLQKYVDAAQLKLMEEKVKRESPDYKWLLKEYYEGILLFEIMEKEIWNKAMEDTTGQRNYFNAHNSKYQAGERLAATIYTASSSKHAEGLEKLLGSEDSVVQDYVARHRVRVDSGAFEAADRAVLSNIPWTTGIHRAENNGVQHIIEVEKILPPGPETFEDARASVISDYQTYLEDSWIRELKRKFGVKVNKKAKKQAFAQLLDK